jgi:C-3',4' desaturase CrtD
MSSKTLETDPKQQLYDVAVVGGGIAGMATAARLQARGLRTLVLEAHSKIGGCAGYFRRQGFAFDVGATTLVDFAPGGVGDALLAEIGMDDFANASDALIGYVAWLPDRTVTLHRDSALWAEERLHMLGDSARHRRFWALVDQLAKVFWNASRQGIKLPVQSPADVLHNVRALGIQYLPLAHYLMWTMGDALRAFGLRDDKALCGLLSMLIEDTVHGRLDSAPLINAALGITIRGAGLTRAHGGMYGFWRRFRQRYDALGGTILLNTRVRHISGKLGAFVVEAERPGQPELTFRVRQVVSAVPASVTERIAPQVVGGRLRRRLAREEAQLGGAIVVFLGVPESEVAGQEFTHHQLLQSYDAPLGDGNNMFISVSAQGDLESAPPGCRAVMISTHCTLEAWEDLSDEAYERKRCAIGEQLLAYARRVYPTLGERAHVFEIGTPRTYARFTGRPRGGVGGVHQTRWNSNQFALPHDIGVAGFWLVGDSTFPGLGTVACTLGSRIVANGVMKSLEA